MKLSQKMDFDHVVEIRPWGENLGAIGKRAITDRPDLYAPNLLDDELDSSEWEFFSGGYTRQDSYSGPVMHNSEFIGGKLESDMLEECGIFCAVVAHWTPDEEDSEEETIEEGWAIVRYVGGDAID